MLKKIENLISIWHYISYEDKHISSDELVGISYLLTNTYDSFTKEQLQSLDLETIVKKDINKTLESINESYSLKEKIDLLLSLIVFLSDNSKQNTLSFIFNKISMNEYLDFLQDVFSNYNNKSFKEIKTFSKKDIQGREFFEDFDFLLIECFDEYKIFIKNNTSLYIYSEHPNNGFSLLSTNRLISLNNIQKFKFESTLEKKELTFDELISILKGKSIEESSSNILKELDDDKEHIKSIFMKKLFCGYDSTKSQTKNLSIEAYSGDLIAIIGPSGSGKSTLFKTLLGMNYIHDGELELNDTTYDRTNHKKIEEKIKHIGYVSQHEVFVKELTVYDNLKYYYKLFMQKKTDEKHMDKTIENVLKSLGIFSKKDQKIYLKGKFTLSGGERKKLNIALELIKNPDILLIDEPTSGLSSLESIELIEMLKNLTKRGKIVFTIIHQPSFEIYKKYNKVIVLNKNGHNIYSGCSSQALSIFSNVLNENNSTDPNILLKANMEKDSFWDVLGILKENFKGEKNV